VTGLPGARPYRHRFTRLDWASRGNARGLHVRRSPNGSSGPGPNPGPGPGPGPVPAIGDSWRGNVALRSTPRCSRYETMIPGHDGAPGRMRRRSQFIAGEYTSIRGRADSGGPSPPKRPRPRGRAARVQQWRPTTGVIGTGGRPSGPGSRNRRRHDKARAASRKTPLHDGSDCQTPSRSPFIAGVGTQRSFRDAIALRGADGNRFTTSGMNLAGAPVGGGTP
jgi:hypothetical protein